MRAPRHWENSVKATLGSIIQHCTSSWPGWRRLSGPASVTGPMKGLRARRKRSWLLWGEKLYLDEPSFVKGEDERSGVSPVQCVWVQYPADNVAPNGPTPTTLLLGARGLQRWCALAGRGDCAAARRPAAHARGPRCPKPERWHRNWASRSKGYRCRIPPSGSGGQRGKVRDPCVCAGLPHSPGSNASGVECSGGSEVLQVGLG
jgi:hypothetical protein